MLCAMTAIPLLFAGACARVVDEDPIQGERRATDPLRALPDAESDIIVAAPIGVRVQVLYGPRRGQTPHGATVWWAVRVLSGAQRDRVGWMAEMAPGTENYHLREVPCPADSLP
jgi:hypothetical protein